MNLSQTNIANALSHTNLLARTKNVIQYAKYPPGKGVNK